MKYNLVPCENINLTSSFTQGFFSFIPFHSGPALLILALCNRPLEQVLQTFNFYPKSAIPSRRQSPARVSRQKPAGKMCTGICHVYRCQCNSVVFKLKEAVKGYTCYQARINRQRGLCKTGIRWAYYDRVSEDSCLYCEIYLGGELSDLTAETCDQGGEPWPEDREDDINDNDTDVPEISGDVPLSHLKAKDKDENEGQDDCDDVDDDDDDDDDDEGGAKLY